MPVTKAIIPVAGWGTRRLPITKVIDKCMLPIGNRPIIDYVVRDCIMAGITDIYFVINQGNTQLQEYYSENERLNQYLQYNAQGSVLELAHPPKEVNFHYIEQDPNDKYGTAVPVAMAVPYLQKGESALVTLGDCFLYNTDNLSEVLRLKQASPDQTNALLAVEVPRERASQYGVVQFDETTGMFEKIVEHPSPEQLPSTYISSGTFILNYDVLLQVYNYCQIQLSGEYQLIEPINQYVLDGGTVQVIPAQGEFLDGGNVHDWLYANQVVLRAA
ncbi:MAG: sugar phosphate nucleotidyltransferase [Candidatus Saccharimonadales bacterium]